MLTNAIFMVADSEKKGALDVRELLGNMVFWLRGDHSQKWLLFFDMFSSINDDTLCSVANIVKIINDSLRIFKETFYLAKTACDKMNTELNGKISYDQFRLFCVYNPQAIDFIARLTIGPYPPSDELQVHMMQKQ